MKHDNLQYCIKHFAVNEDLKGVNDLKSVSPGHSSLQIERKSLYFKPYRPMLPQNFHFL